MATSVLKTNIYISPRDGMGSLDADNNVAVVKGIQYYYSTYPKDRTFVLQCIAGGTFIGLGYIYADGNNAIFNLIKNNGAKLIVKNANNSWSYSYTEVPTFTPVTNE